MVPPIGCHGSCGAADGVGQPVERVCVSAWDEGLVPFVADAVEAAKEDGEIGCCLRLTMVVPFLPRQPAHDGIGAAVDPLVHEGDGKVWYR